MAPSLADKVVAILGANGQIGRTLSDIYSKSGIDLRLFVREQDSLDDLSADDTIRVLSYETFGTEYYDVIINAAGPGGPAVQRNLDSRIVETLDRMDYMVLDYLEDHTATIYLYISTGAVYDGGYTKAVDEMSVLTLPVGTLNAASMYPLAKLAAEARHRARSKACIADIRLFGYVSDRLDPEADYFLSLVLKALHDGSPFETHGTDFVRDVVGPSELVELIDRIIETGGRNDAYDVYSAAPLTKLELLDLLANIFDLKVCLTDTVVTGMEVQKPGRITLRNQAESIGYQPSRTSARIVIEELKKALTRLKSKPVA